MRTYFGICKKNQKNLCVFILLHYFCVMWKEKLGNYLIDVSKFFLTGVFVASLIKDLEDMRWLIYVLSGVVSIALLLLGLILTNKKKEEK